MLPIHGREYNIRGAIWPFAYRLFIYDMWINEADVVDPFFSAFLHLHPTRLEIRGLDEKPQT